MKRTRFNDYRRHRTLSDTRPLPGYAGKIEGKTIIWGVVIGILIVVAAFRFAP